MIHLKVTDRKMARLRRDTAAQLADVIEAIHTEDCPHRGNRISCAKCAERRTIQAAAAEVRHAGGVKQREEARDA